MSDEHNRFHAEKRRQRRDAKQDTSGGSKWRKRPAVSRENRQDLLFYGLHTVRHALLNPDREKRRLFATRNALPRIVEELVQVPTLEIIEKTPRDLDRMVGSDAVHQGMVLEVAPIQTRNLEEMESENLVLVLDQVTDPHNVGAIMRSAVALGVSTLITTSRYSPVEGGVLAKAASGALDLMHHVEVRNLAETLESLHEADFVTVGLDSEGERSFEEIETQSRIALVLGAEGKGLRQKTRATCKHLARLDMPGEIKSLNVSNAAVLSLYLARQKLA